jgi:hypothetical protein
MDAPFGAPPPSAFSAGRQNFCGCVVVSKPRTRRENDFVFVIAGLDPAIHAELHFSMDHRVKRGGDEMKAAREREPAEAACAKNKNYMNAWMPVWARPSTSAWMSCVPS